MKILELKTEIINRYPDIVFIDKSDSENLFLEFSSSTQLEYVYLIWFGTESICASIAATRLNCSDKEYFWHYSFDPYDSDSIENKTIDCLEFLFEQLDILTKLKTRIIQKKNLLSQTFICEYFSKNTWTTLYKHSALKTKFVFPTITSNQKIYE
jgi:hypothetical protein